ncbi:hypothetical protein B0H14DRAFT_3862535 [Mycena olivaceomarginata]|nr:hypothetical protein B0H14DRAFT_3862535 [Mycena olivaceomarginata]
MPSGSTIAARPAHRTSTMPSPTRIVSSPRLSWIGSIQGTFAFYTSADTTLDGWMLKGSRDKGSWSYSRHSATPHRPEPTAILSDPSSFTSQHLQIRRLQAGYLPPVLAHPSVAPVAPSSSAGASPLQQHDTERDALRDYKATARLLDAPRAYDLTPDAPTLYAAQPALSFLDARVALVRDDPLRSVAGYATPLPSVGPAASIPHRIRYFPRHPPATTISGTAPLSSSTDACSSRAAPLAGAAHPLRVQRLPAFPIVPVALVAVRHTTTVFSWTPPSPLGACASVHPQPGLHDHRRTQRPPRPFLLAGVPLVVSALAATSSVPTLPKPTPSLHPPLSRNTTHSLSVVCSICSTGCQSPASPLSPHRMLRRSSWYSDSGAPRFRLSRTTDPMRITSGMLIRTTSSIVNLPSFAMKLRANSLVQSELIQLFSASSCASVILAFVAIAPQESFGATV